MQIIMPKIVLNAFSIKTPFFNLFIKIKKHSDNHCRKFYKSHLASRAYLAYQTAYLKANYPQEYMEAVDLVTQS
jgi:DNA polymerase III alpha subunit